MPLRRLLPAVIALAACESGPPVFGQARYAVDASAAAACAHAGELRGRAPKLLEEGRLDRAVRVLQRAEDLCPAEGHTTWAARVAALAALGRSAEALQLAGRVERSDRADGAARAAAAEARKVAEEHARAVASAGSRRDDPELFDPAEKRRLAAAELHGRALAAQRRGDAAAAKKLFLEAWSAWHPNPRALVEAGLAAEALGDRAEAQRLWDRASYDDAAEPLRPEIPALPPRVVGGASVAWSGDGALLAVAGDEEIAVYRPDLAPLLRLRPGEAVTALGFAGDLLVAALAGGAVRFFDAALGTARGEVAGHRAAVRTLAVSPDGKLLATAAEGDGVRLWDVPRRAELRALATARPVVALAFSPDGARLAFADDAGRLTLSDVRTGAPRSLPRARGAVRALSFEGEALYAVGAAERQRYDLSKPTAPPRTVGRGAVDLASFAPGGGSTAALQVGSEAAAYDLAGAPKPLAATPRPQAALALALSPDRRLIAAIYRDRTLALLPAQPGAPRRETGPAPPLPAFAVAPTGKVFAAAEGDGRVLLWSVSPAGLTALPVQARALAFSPDGQNLALGGERGVDVHDLTTSQTAATLPTQGRVEALAFSPDGLRLAAATDAPSAQLFSPGTPGSQDLRLEAAPVRAVRFSPDGTALLLTPKEGVVRWEPESRRTTRFESYGPEPRDAAFTADGAGIIVADKRGSLHFGKLDGKAPAPGPGGLAVPGQALSLAVAGNGLVATAEGDRVISLRAADGKVLARFKEPDAGVRAVAFLPQGLLAGSFHDGRIRLFRPPVVEAVATLRLIPGLPPGALAGAWESPSGHVELVGPDVEAAKAVVRCRIGPSLYPFQVCAERFAMKGLVAMVLASQDPAEAEP
jgi:WD40 repeat protein